MSHDLANRGIIPALMSACRMTPEQDHAVRFWVDLYVRARKITEDDRRYLLAVWLGDPLD